MEGLVSTTTEIFNRRQTAALSVEDLRRILAHETAEAPPEEEQVCRILAGGQGSLRVLTHPRRRWGVRLGPAAWILAPERSPTTEPKPRTLLSVMRSTLASLGRIVEPGSTIGWARWTRILREEQRIRKHLERRRRRLLRNEEDHLRERWRRPRSTIPLPDLRHRE